MRNNLDSILISSLFSFFLFSSPLQWTSSHWLLFISVRVLVLLLITLFFPAVSQFYDIKTITQPGNRANNHKATIYEQSKAANAMSDQLIGPRGTFQTRFLIQLFPSLTQFRGDHDVSHSFVDYCFEGPRLAFRPSPFSYFGARRDHIWTGGWSQGGYLDWIDELPITKYPYPKSYPASSSILL